MMRRKMNCRISNHEPKKNKNVRWLVVIIALILLIIATIGGITELVNSNIDYQILTEQAIMNNVQAENYAFTSNSVLHIGSEERCFADIEGEKSGAANRHIKGMLVGTEMDIYFIDGILYRKDVLTGSWIGLSVGQLENAVNIMSELEPAVNFDLEAIGEVSFLCKEKIDDKNCYKVSLMPTLKDKWIETYFGNIEYTLWIQGKREPQLVKAIISGVSLENPQAGLVITLSYKNYNEEIILKAPNK